MRRTSPLLILVTLMLAIAAPAGFAAQATTAREIAPATTHRATSSAAPLADVDTDGDGLSDADEILLKTDPTNADSDCDLIDDKTEVGAVAAPTDSDNDGVIDALEHNDADSNKNGTKDNFDPSVGKQVTCGRFKPFAIRNNGTDTTRIELRVVGSNVTAVTMPVYPGSVLDGEPVFLDNVRTNLYDDGTHGDQRAGDGIWSRDGLGIQISVGFAWTRVGIYSEFEVTDSSGTSTVDLSAALNNKSYVALGIVKDDPNIIATPAAIKPNVFATSHLLNVVDPLGALNAAAGGLRLAQATKQLYQASTLSDDYDFIAVMADHRWTADFDAQYNQVREAVTNIGAAPFDFGSTYGSASKLQGVLRMNFSRNPPILHELMHNWGTPDLSTLGFHQCRLSGGHWGVAGIGTGELGGFDPATLVNNNGTYTVGAFGTDANADKSYAPLELYLAGFIDSSSVAPISIPTNVNCASFTYDNSPTGGIIGFTAAGMTTVTIDQIKTVLGGERIPSAATAQKNFKLASVIVTQSPLSAVEMAFYNELIKNASATTGYQGIPGVSPNIPSFAEATGGRGTLNATMYTPPPLLPNAYLPFVTGAQ